MTELTHIYGEGHVAAVYGLEEAIFLHSLMFWYRTNRGNGVNFRDGRWWTYNSVKAFEKVFPWWNAGQIRRIITRCKEKGALLAGDYNEDRRDRTAWYTPSDELLAMYGESENCNCRKQQMQEPDSAGEDSPSAGAACWQSRRRRCGAYGIILDVSADREAFIEQAAEEFVAAMKLYHDTYGQSSFITDWSSIGTHSIKNLAKTE